MAHGIAAFFRLDEAVALLLAAVPDARLLALLLQLSKRHRRAAWDFLSAHTSWDTDWAARFCAGLCRYRGRREPVLDARCEMTPLLVLSAERCSLCRVAGEGMLLYACVYRENDDDRYPGWMLRETPPDAVSCDWYVVARALALAWDTRVLHHSRHVWHRERPPPVDADLCLL